jgi:hypothetical protein
MESGAATACNFDDVSVRSTGASGIAPAAAVATLMKKVAAIRLFILSLLFRLHVGGCVNAVNGRGQPPANATPARTSPII